MPFPISTKPLRSWLGFAFLAAFLTVPSPGQDDSKVELRFVSFPKSLEPVKLELLLAEGKTVMIEAPSNEMSSPIRVPAQPAWIFGEATVDEEGKPAFDVLGRSKAVASPNQIILLVKKGPNKADGFEVLALDGRTNGFGGGKMLFMNAARVKIGADVGERKFVMIPGAHEIIAPKDDGGLCHATLYYDRDGEVRPFFSSKWPVNKNARAMIFIYHDPRSSKLRLHSLREFLVD